MDARSEILQRIKEQEKHKKNILPEPDWKKEVLVSVKGSLSDVFCTELIKIDGYSFQVSTIEELKDKVSGFLRENKVQKSYTSSVKISNALDSQIVQFQQSFKKDVECWITECEVLVAQTGSVFMSSNLAGGRKSWAYPPIHIVVATKNQVVPTIKEALDYFSKKYEETIPSQITMISGSSRTADIEKTLVKGAHGPVKLAVFILNKSSIE